MRSIARCAVLVSIFLPVTATALDCEWASYSWFVNYGGACLEGNDWSSASVTRGDCPCSVSLDLKFQPDSDNDGCGATACCDTTAWTWAIDSIVTNRNAGGQPFVLNTTLYRNCGEKLKLRLRVSCDNCGDPDAYAYDAFNLDGFCNNECP